MPATMTYTGTLVIEECYKCHIVFAMPRDLQKRARESGETFYCPLGHGQVYVTTELQRLQEKLDREQRWRENAEARAIAAHDQAIAAERSRAAYKGQLTRARRRAGNGVCPCCTRSFANVARHMASKHPDWKDDPGE